MTLDNTITQFPQKLRDASDITLDSVILSMTHWRANKSVRGEQIPKEIWDNIFELVKKYPHMPIPTMLGITKMQFQRKLDERKITLNSSEIEAPVSQTKPREYPRMDFCETKEESPARPYKAEKIPATNTLIVEFCRADGRIMKIHTTTDSFAELMKAFFGGV